MKIINFPKEQIVEKLKSNYFLNLIYMLDLVKSDLHVVVKNEEQTLEDEFNVNKSLTEFRGYQCKDDIVVFATRYETKESVEFIIFHEIFHYVMDRALGPWCLLKVLNQKFLYDTYLLEDKELKEDYRYIDSYIKAYDKDRYHEAMPEEKMCNDFAKFITGNDRDRFWWRENIRKVDNANRLAEIAFEETDLASEAQ